jgi:hypothetical protein
MGLTLNSNSLTLEAAGGAAAGLSTADVNTLIKNSTPYQFITKVVADGGTVLDCSNVFNSSDGFTSYRVIFDKLKPTQNPGYIFCRLAFGGTIDSSSIYGWSNIKNEGSYFSSVWETADSRWRVYNNAFTESMIGFLDITDTDSGSRSTGTWHISAGASTSNGGITLGSGSTSLTTEVTGFSLNLGATNSNGFASGNIKIYGINNA